MAPLSRGYGETDAQAKQRALRGLVLSCAHVSLENGVAIALEAEDDKPTATLPPLTDEEFEELRKQHDIFTAGLMDDISFMQNAGAFLPRLLDFAERARKMLGRIEWEGWSNIDGGVCPSCARMENEGHKLGCEMAALVGNP